MLNLFKSQVQSSNQIKFSKSHDLWNDLSLDESSSHVGGHGNPLIWRDPEFGWCRRRLDGDVSCRYREPGIP
ncbi:hypothetical protein [Microcoleus sp. F4-D5]|uniref:hypothetical protein n=1 Tax=Microcoleus sp. F4-D5 TaxID=2818760 RepID=UPI002FD652C8